jgi:hypothetical protein
MKSAFRGKEYPSYKKKEMSKEEEFVKLEVESSMTPWSVKRLMNL